MEVLSKNKLPNLQPSNKASEGLKFLGDLAKNCLLNVSTKSKISHKS